MRCPICRKDHQIKEVQRTIPYSTLRLRVIDGRGIYHNHDQSFKLDIFHCIDPLHRWHLRTAIIECAKCDYKTNSVVTAFSRCDRNSAWELALDTVTLELYEERLATYNFPYL